MVFRVQGGENRADVCLTAAEIKSIEYGREGKKNVEKMFIDRINFRDGRARIWRRY